MCGIAGIVNFNGCPVDIEELKRMNQAMAHRGPDGDGVFCRGNVGLAHRRLAIIDPEAGVQPFYNDDRSIVLSYNGEVYNYIELRRELEPEFHFTTHSDTEVILRAYEKWGMACLERFRGMFAFAIYDSRKNLLYLVRDRVGIKPLFYYHTSDRLLFASEILSILRANGVERRIVPGSLSGFFRYQYVPTPATIYENMYKLEPGHFLEINTRSGKITKQQYWNLTIDIKNRSEAEWLDRLNEVLDDTLRMYVRSDVPFGAFLSGGVDSSLVTALMAKHLDHPVRTFSIGFKEEKHSELPFAAQASRTIKTNHYEKVVSPDLAEDIFVKLVTHFGEPFADSSAIPTYYVSRESASQVKMVLSGDGGDELFGGYNSYQTTFREFAGLPRKPSDLLWRGLIRFAQKSNLRQWALQRQLANFQRSHDAQRQIFDDEQLRALLVPGMSIAPPVSFRVNLACQDIDPVTMFQAQDFKTYLVDDVLTKVDRMSMASSLEVRVPLLDHKIVELAFSLPLSMKLRHKGGLNHLVTKYLLKKSAARFYPESFLERPKQGFGIPLVEWCHGPLSPMIHRHLQDKENPIFQWMQYPYVEKMMNDFYAGREGLAVRIWFVLMFDLWLKNVHFANR